MSRVFKVTEFKISDKYMESTIYEILLDIKNIY